MIRRPPRSTLFPTRRSSDLTVEGGEQRPDFALTSIQFLRNQKAVWPVMFSQREIVDFGETVRSEEHTSELQSHLNLVCRLLLENKRENLLTPLPLQSPIPSS